MIETYRPSGRFGINTLLLGLLGGLVMVAASFVYQLALEWIPFIYVNFLITIGFGMLGGIVASFAINKGHCRNVDLAMLIALLVASAGLTAKHFFQFQARKTMLAEMFGNGEIQAEAADGEVMAPEDIQKAVAANFSIRVYSVQNA